MHEEDYKAKILELETALEESKTLNDGLIERHKELENKYNETVKESNDRISNLLAKNSEMFLRISQPAPEVETVVEEKGPSQESTITLSDILGY